MCWALPTLVLNFKLGRVEVLEYVGMSDMYIVGWSEGQRVGDVAEIHVASLDGHLIQYSN